MVYDRDAQRIWRRRREQGAIHFGVQHKGSPTLDNVRDRSDMFREYDETGKAVPTSGFRWLRDPVNNRTVSVHGIVCPGDLGHLNYPRELGVWTSAGFYGFTLRNALGSTNERLRRLIEAGHSIRSAPVGTKNFISTRWGYVVPLTPYLMVAEYLNTGDLVGSYQRTVPTRMPKTKELLMSKARKAFSTPVVRHHMAHELKAAIEEKGLTVSWIAEQLQESVESARGEKKIPGLKFLMQIHEASALAQAQAVGLLPEGDLVSGVDVLPTDRSPRQFTRHEISTYMSHQDN